MGADVRQDSDGASIAFLRRRRGQIEILEELSKDYSHTLVRPSSKNLHVPTHQHQDVRGVIADQIGSLDWNGACESDAKHTEVAVASSVRPKSLLHFTLSRIVRVPEIKHHYMMA